MTTIIIQRANTVHFSGVNLPRTSHHEQQAQHSRSSRTDGFVFHGDIYGYAHNATSDAGSIIAYNHTAAHHDENPSLSRGGGTEHLSHSRDLTMPQTVSPMDTSSVNLPEYTLSSPAFATPSSPPTELANISPPMLTDNFGGQELSYDSLSSGRLSRVSRGSLPTASFTTVPRSQRFNPIAVPANRLPTGAPHRRKASRSSTHEDDNDDDEFKPGGSIAATDASRDSRVPKQRAECEQWRRDELKEGYRLKEIPPSSNQQASKVSILDSALSHIKYLESRLKGADQEVHRLRNVNEALMLNRAGAANPASSAFSN